MSPQKSTINIRTAILAAALYIDALTHEFMKKQFRGPIGIRWKSKNCLNSKLFALNVFDFKVFDIKSKIFSGHNNKKTQQSRTHSLRQQAIKTDPFGMNLFEVGYSLSKRKRWLLPEYFEKNAHKFQVSVEK